jgi:hypothetical protein
MNEYRILNDEFRTSMFLVRYSRFSTRWCQRTFFVFALWVGGSCQTEMVFPDAQWHERTPESGRVRYLAPFL